MLPKNTKKLIVLDPALIATGGHHIGFALMAARSHKESEIPIELEFVCSHCLDEAIKSELEEQGCHVRPEFHLNFYELFNQSTRLEDVQPFIRQAAREYAHAIRESKANYPGQELLFFHPSLNWEHAFALSLAIRTLETNDLSTHLVCAMFNPGIGYDGTTLSPLTKMNFRLGFGALQQLPNVKLFASDSELSEKYTDLLGLNEALLIHPCYLANWESIKNRKFQNSDKGNGAAPGAVILYMGDAKRDKGFLELPDLTRWSLEHAGIDQRFYIQFSIPWPDQQLQDAAACLQEISRSDPRLNVEYRFLSEAEMNERLATASMFTFNYCPRTYTDKSSGFLWVVAWYGLLICCLEDSWLSREARRLGRKPVVCRRSRTAFLRCLRSVDSDKPNTAGNTTQYGKQLYESFWKWLQRISHENHA